MLPTIVSTETLHEGFTRKLRLRIRTEAGEEQVREVEDAGDAVAVLPFDPARRTVMLVRALRPGPLIKGDDPWSLEAPAGYVDDGETPEQAAAREVLEEVGLRLRALRAVTRGYSTPGRSSERLSLFLAEYDVGDRVGEGGGLAREAEGLRLQETALSHVAQAVEDGVVTSLPTIALFWRLRLERPELFG